MSRLAVEHGLTNPIDRVVNALGALGALGSG